MKILIDPKLSVFIQDLTDAQCAELLRCIFCYPDRDCDLGIWKYMKQQIAEDAKKYKEKCDRIAEIRNKRENTFGLSLKSDMKSGMKSDMKSDMKSGMKSDMKSEMISGVIEDVEEIKNKKEKEIKRSERGISSEPVENYVEKPFEIQIDDNFSFERISEMRPAFKTFLEMFPLSVVIKAEESLKKKRNGQWVQMINIVQWVEKENSFYTKNQGV